MCYIKCSICNICIGKFWMKRAFIKIFLIILVFVLNINFCHAKHAIKMIADVDTEFTAKTTELPDKIYFKTVT